MHGPLDTRLQDSTRDGFSCRRCGACCRGPGDVVLESGEVERIASLLGLALYAFTARYTRLLDDRQGLSLTERPDGACIFLQDDNSCRIQGAKPQQCRGFPHAWRSERLMATCAGLRAADDRLTFKSETTDGR